MEYQDYIELAREQGIKLHFESIPPETKKPGSIFGGLYYYSLEGNKHMFINSVLSERDQARTIKWGMIKIAQGYPIYIILLNGVEDDLTAEELSILIEFEAT